MINIFLDFRFSQWWYIFIIAVVIIITMLLSLVKKRSTSDYQRYTHLIVSTMSVALIICALCLLVLLVRFGLSKDWIANYTHVLLVIGPILIACLIFYAIKKEKGIKKK